MDNQWINCHRNCIKRKPTFFFFFLENIFHTIFNNFWKIIGKVILFHFAVPKYLNYITLRLSDFTHTHTHCIRSFVSGADSKKMALLVSIHAVGNPEESIVRGVQNPTKAFHRLSLSCRSDSQIPMAGHNCSSRIGRTHFYTSIISLSV